MKPLSRLLVALCLTPVLAQAAPLSQVTLPDGRQVQLNDDFTWEYLVVKPAEPVQSVAAEGNAGAVVAVAAPVLTDQAKANPELLAQMARDGVLVKLDKIEGSDPLALTFMVSNTGSRNVVGVIVVIVDKAQFRVPARAPYPVRDTVEQAGRGGSRILRVQRQHQHPLHPRVQQRLQLSAHRRLAVAHGGQYRR